MKGINLATQKIQDFNLNEQRDLSAKNAYSYHTVV